MYYQRTGVSIRGRNATAAEYFYFIFSPRLASRRRAHLVLRDQNKSRVIKRRVRVAAGWPTTGRRSGGQMSPAAAHVPSVPVAIPPTATRLATVPLFAYHVFSPSGWCSPPGKPSPPTRLTPRHFILEFGSTDPSESNRGVGVAATFVLQETQEKPRVNRWIHKFSYNELRTASTI